jgi:hypothetical protein
MNTQRARKTSGTHSMWDMLTHPGTLAEVLQGGPHSDPADDLASLEQAVPLTTSAFRKLGWRWRQGRLLFQFPGTVPIAWQAGIYRSRRSRPTVPPVRVDPLALAGLMRFPPRVY